MTVLTKGPTLVVSTDLAQLIGQDEALAQASQFNTIDVTDITMPSSRDKRSDRFHVSRSDTKDINKKKNKSLSAYEMDEVTHYLIELPPPTHALRGGRFLRPPACPPVLLVG